MTDRPCATGLTCLTGLHAFGGYCASACEPCDGACVGTPRGETCMAACTSDAQCRASEGYVCDPQWKACVMPNSTSIVPHACAAPRGIGRNPAFDPTEVIGVANQAAAAIASDGHLVTLADRRDPSLARDAKSFYAAWTAEDHVVAATSPDGVTWPAGTPLDACDDCRPLVVAGGGSVYVMYGGDGLRVRASRDGTTFGAPVTALAGGWAGATVGSDGRVHVVAIDGGPLGAFGSANQRVQYTVSADGGRSFAKPITVSKRDELLPFYFATPAVAVDTRRKLVYVAYVRGGRDAVWDLVLAASKDGGKTWTRQRLGDDCAIHMVPSLAVDAATGTVHATWYDTRGGARFAHATCTVGLGSCTQVGRINDVPSAALSTVRRAATSIGDTTSLVVDDKRRILHAVWTQPVDEAGKIVVKVFHAKAKLR